MPGNVVIEDKQGRRYAIDPKAFDKVKDAEGKTFAERGFKIVSYEDGTPWEPKAKAAPEEPA